MSFFCPHCGLAQVPTDKNSCYFNSYGSVGVSREMVEQAKGASQVALTGQAIRCADPDCSRLTVGVFLGSGKWDSSGAYKAVEGVFASTRLYPAQKGKPFPHGVPEPMLEDYNEAWSIIDLSPKSSATLARRCLQAMIRDFCGIKERTLYHEIEALEQSLQADALPKGVEPETVAAMRVLKDKGNIGAHMTEVDGKIVNVDPDEARLLLGLIEMLFSDWYVARHKRQERLAAIEAMANPPASNP